MKNSKSDNWRSLHRDIWHNTLQNFYLLKLRVFIKKLESGSIKSEDLMEFSDNTMTVWETRLKGELNTLLQNFETSLSPSTYFDEFPKTMKKHHWLESLIHELWKARCPSENWLQKTREAYDEIDLNYTGILQKIKGSNPNGQESLKEILKFKNYFQDLKRSLDNLYNTLQAFRIEEFL
jgi:hypothetical protein